MLLTLQADALFEQQLAIAKMLTAQLVQALHVLNVNLAMLLTLQVDVHHPHHQAVLTQIVQLAQATHVLNVKLAMLLILQADVQYPHQQVVLTQIVQLAQATHALNVKLVML